MAKGLFTFDKDDWNAIKTTYGVTKNELKYVGKGVAKHGTVHRNSDPMRIGIPNMPPGGPRKK